ncbi:hypothetical protein EJI20_09955 [Salmonella enterica subsp. enterica serovar Napoli]|nr:hypothetical protein [Salmonella enterica subsp. enterica serovar Napoli]EDR3389936.1 hypothetical protein [Salmonella enterica subsp. enterica serovar Zaiman]EDW0152504.1 hypothetical protein [Salmonella enterica subsp. enterica]
MRSHDRLRIVFDKARQNWRAFAYVMQVHENHYIKWAGVAGIRARADVYNCINKYCFSCSIRITGYKISKISLTSIIPKVRVIRWLIC